MTSTEEYFKRRKLAQDALYKVLDEWGGLSIKDLVQYVPYEGEGFYEDDVRGVVVFLVAEGYLKMESDFTVCRHDDKRRAKVVWPKPYVKSI